MERVKGFEPSSSAWKAEVLPLNYTRTLELIDLLLFLTMLPTDFKNLSVLLHLPKWWREEDSNLRRLSQQIYSLPPLTARESLHQASR